MLVFYSGVGMCMAQHWSSTGTLACVLMLRRHEDVRHGEPDPMSSKVYIKDTSQFFVVVDGLVD